MRGPSLLLVFLVLVGLLGACGAPQGGDEDGSSPAAGAVVASYDGGEIVLAEIEERLLTTPSPACIEMRRAGADGSLDWLMPCYREVAEGLVLERLVLADLDDVDAAIEAMDEYQDLLHHAFLTVYFENLAREIEIDDAEIEGHFEDHPELYHRPAQLTLWTIFRRHEDPDDQQRTLDFLRELRQRFLAGETFDSLARQYSHSETQQRGGLVGQIRQGQLPQRLETIAFALAEGDVSEPITVRDGAVLMHARNIIEEVDLSLQSVREAVRRELIAQQVAELTSDRVAGRPLPEESTVLPPEQLIAALGGDDSEAVVLDIAGEPLTVEQMRRQVGLQPSAAVSGLDDDQLAQIHEVYEAQKTNRLLLLDLLESHDPELGEQVAEHLRVEGVERLVDAELLEEMGRLVDDDLDKLRRYWEDNQHHYQSPLRFKLQLWTLPFDENPPRQLRRLEKLHVDLSAGELTLAAAAAELGGAIKDLGWREASSLQEEIPPKASSFLLQIGDSGFSAPYQQREALHVIWLVERQEPGPQQYDEAQEQVRADYISRFQEQLYREVLDGRLAAAHFSFDEHAVRLLLAPPILCTTRS